MWMREVKDKLAGHTRQPVARGGLLPAAVLLPLSVEMGSLCLTLIERTEVVNHAGQISFPGGHYEEADGNLLQTALRETGEEIGVDTDRILPLGQVSDQITPTGFWIRPFVGAIPAGNARVADTREVSQVFTVPIVELKKKQNLPALFQWRGTIIWGVTARFLDELLTVIQR